MESKELFQEYIKATGQLDTVLAMLKGRHIEALCAYLKVSTDPEERLDALMFHLAKFHLTDKHLARMWMTRGQPDLAMGKEQGEGVTELPSWTAHFKTLGGEEVTAHGSEKMETFFRLLVGLPVEEIESFLRLT